MSDTETWTGTLKPTGKTVAQFMEGKDQPRHLNMPDDLMEWFADSYYQEAIVYEGLVYEVEKKDIADSDIAISTVNPDGTISFTISYYNGGCSFSEAIEEALENKEIAPADPDALIKSAAPELLKCTEDAVKFIESIMPQMKNLAIDVGLLNTFFIESKAAIAKAKGE